LFNRSWWKRTWVAQEALLAGELIFLCGKETMDWPSLWTVLENIWAHSHWARNTLPNGSDLVEKSSPGRSILWLRQKKERLDLIKTLYHLRPSLCTDPRDKVYGVLGLASDAKLIVPAPNYSLTMKGVLINLLEKLTSVRKDIDWLLLAGDLGGDSELPSWCPDLIRRSPLVSMNTSRSMKDGKNRGFCAASDTEPMVSLTFDPMSCAVERFLVDLIDGLAPQGGVVDGADVIQPQCQHNAYATDAEAYSAIWKTIVADQDFEGMPDAWRAPDSFGSLFAKHARIAEVNSQNSNEAGAK
jgi:hypothetical protein